VADLCQDITKTFHFKRELVAECERLKGVPAPAARLAADRTLHRLLAYRDAPQVFCHAFDAGTSGRVEAATREGVSCSVELRKGQAIAADVPDYGIEGENAFLWAFLLEPRDLAPLRFVPLAHATRERSIAADTRALLRDALYQ